MSSHGLLQFGRYLIAGGTGAALNFVIYLCLLQVFGVWYILASIISFTLSIFAGFYLQKYLTFRNISREHEQKQIVYYFIFSLFNLLINVILLAFFVEVMGIGKVFAKILTLAIIAVWSFSVYQKVIFRTN